MLTTVHILLTYTCPLRCKHCFVFGDPRAKGTFTPAQVTRTLTAIRAVESVEWVYFQGGEPFYHYPLLLSSVKKAIQNGFKVGVITNAYFARTESTAARFLKPLRDLGVANLCISQDTYHYPSPGDTPARRALRAAANLGLPARRASVDPSSSAESADPGWIGKDFHSDFKLQWRGRAAEKLTPGALVQDWRRWDHCPSPNLANPWRVDIDPYGNVQICQGVNLGNLSESSFDRIITKDRIRSHPIISFLRSGGPAALANAYDPNPHGSYVDACHLCYTIRLSLLDRFPSHLTPRQLYGL
jgi:MoaA/NifB/PqqE/SkfB family radical SAM enzyme